MSGINAEARASLAREISERAADWIQRRSFWDWSEADQAELDAWLAASPAHLVAYLRLEAAWTRTERLVALGHTTTDGDGALMRPFPFLIRIAAVLAIVAVFGILAAKYVRQPHDRVFSTPVGGRETVAFADGTKIELNTDTVLRARMTTGERMIWLEKGEAFFQVKYDSSNPFVVFLGRHHVMDLGTKFLVRRDPGQLEVALLEGRVRFGTSNGDSKAQTTLLTPGDVATATTSTMFITKENLHQLANELGWRHGVLVFKHTTLATAVKEFNRYNRRQMIIADPAAAGLTIDGTFPVNNIEDFSRLAQVVLGLHVENHGDEIVIRSNR